MPGRWKPGGRCAGGVQVTTPGGQTFKLTVDNAGVIRGTYYNALTDETQTVFGQVDEKCHRAAWTVGDKKTHTYEAGIINLTENETTMMVYYSNEKSQQFTLIRIEQPDGSPGKP